MMERMLEVSRFIDLSPLLNHFVLRVDGDYLGPKILFKRDRDFDALHKWLVSHSPIKQRKIVSLDVKVNK